MSKYCKKSDMIDAIEFTGDFSAIEKWVSQWYDEDDGPGMWSAYEDTELIVSTLKGEMRATIGDFIIRDAEGEFYIYKSDMFASTYEKV